MQRLTKVKNDMCELQWWADRYFGLLGSAGSLPSGLPKGQRTSGLVKIADQR
jgi:hypothetical protein